MARESIAKLKVYRAALAAERQIYDLTLSLSEEQFFDIGNDLHRAAAGMGHYLKESHDQYSYQLKIESLHQARRCAEEALKLLDELKSIKSVPAHLAADLTSIIKQTWGLIKYLKLKQAERQQAVRRQASDELVASRQ